MGNTYCAGAREKLDDSQKATMEYYNKMSENMKRKLEKTKKVTKEKVSIMRLRVKGYSLNYFDDNGETKVISDFENRIPLRLVPLDAFDGPLEKL
jgi:mRNA-degrading endonuclease RelE of RelBE toxin-antitoxin system